MTIPADDMQVYPSFAEGTAARPDACTMYKANTWLGEMWAADMLTATILLKANLSIEVWYLHHNRGWEKR